MSRKRGRHMRQTRRGGRVAAVVVTLLVVALGLGAGLVVVRRPSSPTASEAEASASEGNVGSADVAAAAPELGAQVGDVGSSPDETESTEEAEAVEITIVAVGDVLQHQGVWESGLEEDGTYDFHHVFAHLGDALDGADLKVVNQESILGGDVAPFSSYPSFNGPQEMGDAEADAGFNVILRASNHTMDMGYEGLRSELSFWHTQHPEIAVLGAVDPQDTGTSVDDVYVYEKEGFRVALLNYTYGLNGYTDPEGAVSMLEEAHVRQTLATASEEADMVVVFPHWGEEYQLAPVESQLEWEEFLRESGADVIIGAHPHVIEPVETFERRAGGDGVCYWSLGNFVSGQNDDESLVGGMARVTLRKDGDGATAVASASLEPVITHKGRGDDMTVYRLRDYTDELAATNGFAAASNASLTPAWAREFCASVLGDDFDPQTCIATVALD